MKFFRDLHDRADSSLTKWMARYGILILRLSWLAPVWRSERRCAAAA